ncbi:hypothetical protein FRC11_001149 [Ceratobasidium sp. 423]|nr:hypothetical protein FRC11_001149 [Ceratobasidium sp. 423]
MGTVHTKIRNRLKTETVEKIMRVKMHVDSRHEAEGLQKHRKKREYGHSFCAMSEDGQLAREQVVENEETEDKSVIDRSSESKNESETNEHIFEGEHATNEYIAAVNQDYSTEYMHMAEEGGSGFPWHGQIPLENLFDYRALSSQGNTGWLLSLWGGGIRCLADELAEYNLNKSGVPLGDKEKYV